MATLEGTLRGGLYRCESFDDFSKIHKIGYIYPRNQKNSSKWTNSYAQYLGAVALFDFKNPSDENFESSRDSWYQFFSIEFMPVTIAIGFDWEALKSKIILYNKARFNDSVKLKKRLIPHVEAWYPEPLSLNYMTHLIVICSVNTEAFKILQPSDTVVSEIGEIVTEFQSMYKEDYRKYNEKVGGLENALNKHRNK
jgi:hypothetical protein